MTNIKTHTLNPNFENTYNKQANAFAEHAPKLIWWNYIGVPILDRYITFQNNMKVLDIWSASWRVSIYLTNKDVFPKNITGVEISANQIDIAKQRVPGVNFLHDDIRTVILQKNFYDTAIANMVVEFLDNEWLKQAFQNIYDSLKDNWEFITITTHPNRMMYWSTTKKVEGWFKTMYPWGENWHTFYREIDTFIDIAKDVGFRIQEIEEYEIPDLAKIDNPKEYSRYKSYGNIRLSFKFIK